MSSSSASAGFPYIIIYDHFRYYFRVQGKIHVVGALTSCFPGLSKFRDVHFTHRSILLLHRLTKASISSLLWSAAKPIWLKDQLPHVADKSSAEHRRAQLCNSEWPCHSDRVDLCDFNTWNIKSFSWRRWWSEWGVSITNKYVPSEWHRIRWSLTKL